VLKSPWLAVLVLALAARGAVLTAVLPHPERVLLAQDSVQYLERAQALARGAGFGVLTEQGLTPDVRRTPGYPALLALLILVTGNPAPLLLLAVTQAVIGGALVLAVMALARRLTRHASRAGPALSEAAVAVIAGLLYALAPISAVMTAYAYAEVLFTAHLVLAAWLAVVGLERGHRGWLVAAGAVYGLATLTRPIGLLLLPLVLLLPLAAPRHPPPGITGPHGGEPRPLRVRLGYVGVLLAGYALVVGPWLIRNAVLFDRPSISSISDYNLYHYNAASLEAHRRRIGLHEARARLAAQLAREPAPQSRWPYAAESALARKVILAHPVEFVVYNGVDALNGLRPGFSFMLSLMGSDSPAAAPIRTFASGTPAAVLREMRSQTGALLALEVMFVGYVVIVASCGIVGLALLLRRRHWLALTLLAAIPALLLYLPGIASNARFRAPVEPFLAILAALGLGALRARRTPTSPSAPS
jgi:hypothetical protein